MEGRSPPFVQKVARQRTGEAIEVWFQDEARFGQKGTLTRQWTRRGRRRTAIRQTSYQNVWLAGAVCPQTGEDHALLLPKMNASTMQQWLDSFAAARPAGTHVILVLDNAGWHRSKDLRWPPNVTPLFLPPYSPELNPIENLWGWLKNTYLANKVFPDYDALLDAGTHAWRQLTPQRVRSLCRASWVNALSL